MPWDSVYRRGARVNMVYLLLVPKLTNTCVQLEFLERNADCSCAASSQVETWLSNTFVKIWCPVLLSCSWAESTPRDIRRPMHQFLLLSCCHWCLIPPPGLTSERLCDESWFKSNSSGWTLAADRQHVCAWNVERSEHSLTNELYSHYCHSKADITLSITHLRIMTVCQSFFGSSKQQFFWTIIAIAVML